MFMITLPLAHYIPWNYKVDETNLHLARVSCEMKHRIPFGASSRDFSRRDIDRSMRVLRVNRERYIVKTATLSLR